jgi:hypothetical protein
VFGGVAGVIVGFLPLETVNVFRSEWTMLVLESRGGQFALLGYVGALVFSVLLYPSNRRPRKSLCWGGLAAGALCVLAALEQLLDRVLVVSLFNGPSQLRIGVGAYLNVLAAAAVAVGACLKAREEKKARAIMVTGFVLSVLAFLYSLAALAMTFAGSPGSTRSKLLMVWVPAAIGTFAVSGWLAFRLWYRRAGRT